VRELENVLERVTAFSESTMIDAEQLPQELLGDELSGAVSRPSLGGYTLAEIERSAIIETLELCGGNKSRAARSLGISEKSIYNKMKRFGIMKSGDST
jgi:DNA-binding NtrC family response regulator